MDPDDFGDVMAGHFRDHRLVFEDRGDVAFQAHRERPYLGQAQTVHGERGKCLVKGVSMRDVADCIARGFAEALAPGDGWDFDQHAMVQNAMANVEKAMGIYPNVPPLGPEDEDEHRT